MQNKSFFYKSVFCVKTSSLLLLNVLLKGKWMYPFVW